MNWDLPSDGQNLIHFIWWATGQLERCNRQKPSLSLIRVSSDMCSLPPHFLQLFLQTQLANISMFQPCLCVCERDREREGGDINNILQCEATMHVKQNTQDLLSLKRSTASGGQAAQRLESILITVINVEEEMTGGETTSYMSTNKNNTSNCAP